MHEARGSEKHLSRLSRSLSRRDVVMRTAKITAGAALATLPIQRWTQRVAAQDDGVTLSGGVSEVSAGPGSAAAIAAAAAAMVDGASARIQAAAALAHADSEAGAITQSPVAAAIADPELGATAQGALAVASASSASDGPSSTYGGGGRAPRSRGRRIRSRGGKGRMRVKKLPSTGSGITPPSLSSLLVAGAVLAAGGAAALRVHGASDEVPSTPAGE
jgi:hypothetical protein